MTSITCLTICLVPFLWMVPTVCIDKQWFTSPQNTSFIQFKHLFGLCLNKKNSSSLGLRQNMRCIHSELPTVYKTLKKWLIPLRLIIKKYIKKKDSCPEGDVHVNRPYCMMVDCKYFGFSDRKVSQVLLGWDDQSLHLLMLDCNWLQHWKAWADFIYLKQTPVHTHTHTLIPLCLLTGPDEICCQLCWKLSMETCNQRNCVNVSKAIHINYYYKYEKFFYSNYSNFFLFHEKQWLCGIKINLTISPKLAWGDLEIHSPNLQLDHSCSLTVWL